MNLRKKKILIVCDASRTLLTFRGKLIEKMQHNHQVYIFSPKITQDFIRMSLTNLGAIIIENDLDCSNVSIVSDLKYLWLLHKTIREIKPDVFFPYAFKPVIYGTFLAKLNKVKMIAPMLTGLGYNFADSDVKNRTVANITKLLLKLSLRKDSRLNLIFQNSDDVKKLIELKVISDKHNTHVVNGSGVDLSHFEYVKPKTAPITFLMIARLINAKGISDFFQAAKIIQAKYPQTKFRLLGDYDKNIDSICKELYHEIISGKPIEYLGHVDDVRPEIVNSSVVVLPSYYREGVPRSLLESMAIGRAIITCDSPGCKETINTKTGRENGFLILPRDPIALASKMEFFIMNPETIVDFGKKGLAFAQEKFDVDIINNDMLKIMELH